MRKIIIASLSAFALAGAAACGDTTDDDTMITETDPAVMEEPSTMTPAEQDAMTPGTTDDMTMPPADTTDTTPMTDDDMTTPPAQ
mgnify:CR=1 FL=1